MSAGTLSLIVGEIAIGKTPDALNAINLQNMPQSEPVDPHQVPNSAGGFTFTVAPLDRLRRFLVLGTHGRTNYASERGPTTANADVMLT